LKQDSGSNIVALFAIIYAIGSGLHGPFAPEAKHARVRTQLSVERKNLRGIGHALESYREETGKYPAKLMPYLTTPTSYLSPMPIDGFSEPRDYFTFRPMDDG